MRPVVLLLAAAVGAAVAGADPAWDANQRTLIAERERTALAVDDAWQVGTPHYRIIADSSARLAAETASYLELARPQILAELAITLREHEVCEVRIYASRARYRAAFGSINSRGRFDWSYADEDAPPVYVVSTWLSRDDAGLADVIPILTHECTHQLMQASACRHAIPWLVQEGVATYFQTWDAFHDREWNHVHHVNEFRRELRRACDDRRVPSLPTLAQLEVWDADGFGPITNTRYGCAESLIGFLLRDQQRRPFARRLIGTALDGGDVAAVLASDEGRRLEAAWRRSLDDDPS